MLVSPYFYDRDTIFHWKENKYPLVKDGKTFVIKPHVRKSVSLIVLVGKMKILINSCCILTLITMRTIKVKR